MSKPENNEGGKTPKYIKPLLIVIVCVALWLALQSLTGVPMKM